MRVYGRVVSHNKRNASFKKPIFKKLYSDKLFSVSNFKYDGSKFLLHVGDDVIVHAKDSLGLDLHKPKQLESYLRKSFRALFGYKV